MRQLFLYRFQRTIEIVGLHGGKPLRSGTHGLVRIEFVRFLEISFGFFVLS